MTEETSSRLHATIAGRVQGVSFRYFVMEQADKLNLRGWVRNRWNGTVEVTAEGAHQDLELLLAALREGPPMAVIDNVCYDWLAATGEFISFDVVSTI
ncbi:MAG: acylphosphatase [Anaerolineales bacterium]|nr:acylphosphatase [Anaerolineae bacterium]PWB52061.1 MAG: acylphosphatase [Anaerolineales bacterium]